MVMVSEDSLASVGGVLPAEGTLYSDAAWKTLFAGDYRKQFSNFRYVQQLEDTKEGGTLVFSRVLTESERNTPFRSITTFGNHRWDPILKVLKPIAVRDFPLTAQTSAGTVEAVRYLTKEVYIPGVNEGTRFLTEEFTSDVKYDIPQYSVPIASSVSFSYINFRTGFPECLHEKLTIDDLISTTAITAGGVTTDNYNQIKGQVFPATNFTEWASYILSDTQELTGGVYYRKRIRVFPPPIPETITTVQ